ncbi:MAG TPA: alkaline phosphatase family protein [Kiloniellaceae bacterium]|nr:alkaline phosphatase family protein [Kiloniellaceae bacterium]
MPRSRPNVLFITADQMRAECLSIRGHPVVKTPNLDRLAADGALFANHYGQSVPCAPARASLYCGLYQHKHRLVLNGAPLDARHSNIALEARKLGYLPALFGYTDIAPDPRRLPPGDPTLTTYEGILPGLEPVLPLTDNMKAWRAHLLKKGYDLPPPEKDFAYLFQQQAAQSGDPGPTYAPAFFAAEDSNTAFVTDAVLDRIAGEGDDPWFIHLSYLSPHPPFVVAAPYNSLYDADAIAPPRRRDSLAAEADQHPFLAEALYHPPSRNLTKGRKPIDHHNLDRRALCQVRATYYGMITEVDHHIGRILDALQAQGLYERTLIVFTCDHGELLGDHWLFGKTTYFDASYHIPLIVRDPRPEARRGITVDAFTEAVDVMPSILAWLGATPPRTCDGRSLLPFLQGAEPDDWRQEIHWEFDFRSFSEERSEPLFGLTPEESSMVGQRGKRYKLVHFAKLPPLLFDLQEDPDEFDNRAEDPAYRDILLEETQKMLSWRIAQDDRTLTNLRLTDAGIRALG